MMFENVLLPLDFSRDSRYAIQCLTKIPTIQNVVLLHVVYTRYPSKKPGTLTPDEDYARLQLEEVKKKIVLPKVRVSTVIEKITGGEISDAIKKVARQENTSLIVMGRRGRGIIESLLLGSVASDVLYYGTNNMLLVPSPKPEDAKGTERDFDCPDLFSHVMVCTDFSEPRIGSFSRNEMSWIGQVSLFHVVTSGDSEEEVRASVEAAEMKLRKLRDEFVSMNILARVHVRVGSAAEEILSFSRDENISLILMKSTGKRGLLTQILGSTTAHVARNAQKPVLILRKLSPGG